MGGNIVNNEEIDALIKQGEES
jgi:hypothetical protein